MVWRPWLPDFGTMLLVFGILMTHISILIIEIYDIVQNAQPFLHVKSALAVFDTDGRAAGSACAQLVFNRRTTKRVQPYTCWRLEVRVAPRPRSIARQ